MSICFDSSKKKKRLRKVFSFNTFPRPDDASPLHGPFRKNIMHFLPECGEILDQIDGMLVWRIRLINNNNKDVSLYVFQQPTKECCDYCCQSGWSHHYITKKTYHLIIPREDKPLDSSIFKSESSILYGFIHNNGFGHLVCINGRPEFVYDYEQVMDLWDRLCTHLETREITVQDPSWKRGLPVRFLYEIAYGRPWFARWEYKYCKGSFGISESDYTAAINMVRSIQLNDLPFRDSDALAIICWCRTLDSSLKNLADLFKFMLTLKPQDPQMRRVPADAEPWSFLTTSEKKGMQEDKDRWPKKKLERVEQFAKLVVNELKKRTAESGDCERGMTGQQVWQAARVYFGGTALVDDALKLLNYGTVGDDIICCAVNSQTHMKEYIVREANQNDRGVDLLALSAVKRGSRVPGDIISDLDYLYNELRFCIDSKVVQLAVKTIVETKIFVKEWPHVPKFGVLRRVSCSVRPSLEELEDKFTRRFPPGEHIVVTKYCTVEELKIYVQCGMRDTYHIMDRVTITELEGESELHWAASWRDIIAFPGGESLRSGNTARSEFGLRFKATDFAFENELMYNGGKDRVVVKCNCGANDFDGERMTECDECKIWQHTRCSGIDISKRDCACISCLSIKMNKVLHFEDDIFC